MIVARRPLSAMSYRASASSRIRHSALPASFVICHGESYCKRLILIRSSLKISVKKYITPFGIVFSYLSSILLRVLIVTLNVYICCLDNFIFFVSLNQSVSMLILIIACMRSQFRSSDVGVSSWPSKAGWSICSVVKHVCLAVCCSLDQSLEGPPEGFTICTQICSFIRSVYMDAEGFILKISSFILAFCCQIEVYVRSGLCHIKWEASSFLQTLHGRSLLLHWDIHCFVILCNYSQSATKIGWSIYRKELRRILYFLYELNPLLFYWMLKVICISLSQIVEPCKWNIPQKQKAWTEFTFSDV